MNKFFTNLILVLLFSTSLTAQVGIGTTSPDASSALEVASTDKGFLMPRMTTIQREAIATPANGLMVFDTDTNSQWTYTGGVWGETKVGVGKFVDGATPDIAYYEGKVGIGIDAFGNAHKLYVQAKRSDDATNTPVRIDAVYEGSGTATAGYGLAAFSTNAGSATVDYAIGTQGIVNNSNSGGTINYGVGSWPEVNNSGTMGYGAGFVAEAKNNAGTAGTMRGIDISVLNKSAASIGTASLASFYAINAGTITGDGYGLFVGGEGNGTVNGNSYGIYLSTPYSTVTGNAFALYSVNANNSYLEGNLGVGTDEPQQKVHISGVLRLEPQAAIPTGGFGDLYVNTDGTLYFHNGVDWKAVLLAP